MNKNKDRLLIHYFMRMLQQRMEKEKTKSISPVFAGILSRKELRDILQWLFMDKVPEDYNPDTMSSEDLLEAIGDDLHILSYTIHRWKKELEEKATSEKVYDVLSQLQLETHYLMTKILQDWDEYDHSNFRALCLKAGYPETLYGIFHSDVSEEDKYIAVSPANPYKTEWEARETISRMISEGKFKEGELKIMKL